MESRDPHIIIGIIKRKKGIAGLNQLLQVYFELAELKKDHQTIAEIKN